MSSEIHSGMLSVLILLVLWLYYRINRLEDYIATFLDEKEKNPNSGDEKQ